MNSKDKKNLVTDAKALNKSPFKVTSTTTSKYPSTGFSKTVTGSTKDAKQAFFASSSSSSSSTSKYKESSQKSFTTTTKITSSSWTTSAAAAAESKNILKSTPISKYPPPENKYNSYSSINKESTQIPTSSIFYSLDKTGQKSFGSDIHANKYVSPYRGQGVHDPYANKSASETAKWSELKTNPALYKRSTATINSIQKPLGSLVLTTAAGAAMLNNEREPQIKTNVTPTPVSRPTNTTVPKTTTPSTGYVYLVFKCDYSIDTGYRVCNHNFLR